MKRYVSGRDLIASVKSPKSKKEGSFRPLREPSRGEVRVRIQKRRPVGGGVPMPRAGVLSHHF